MKRLVFYGACMTAACINAARASARHDWWPLAFHVLSFIIFIGSCAAVIREARRQHHRDMLKAFDLGRMSILREQREMARRRLR